MTDAQKKLVTELNDKMNRAVSNKRLTVSNWLLNYNFINGKQDVYVDEATGLLRDNEYDAELYQESGALNKIEGVRNAYIAKTTRVLPKPYAYPLSDSAAEHKAAAITTSVINELWTKKRVPRILRKCAESIIDTGSALVKVSWSDKTGPKWDMNLLELMSRYGTDFTDEEKKKLEKRADNKGDIKLGDVQFELVKPFELLVPIMNEDVELEDQPWIAHCKVFDKGEAERKFGLPKDSLKDVKEDNTVLGSLVRMNKNKTFFNSTKSEFMFDRDIKEDSVLVKEMQIKPCSEYPDGKFVIICGNKIIEELDHLPYKTWEEDYGYNIIKVGLSSPGLFWGNSIVSQLIEPQRKLNQLHNRSMELLTRSVNGAIAVQEGSMDEEETIVNEPGAIIKYKQGFAPPQTMTVSGNTFDTVNYKRVLDSDFQQISALSPLSLYGNTNNSAMRSGQMGSLAISADETKFGLITENLSLMAVEMFRFAISIYKEFMLDFDMRYVKNIDKMAPAQSWRKEQLLENVGISNKDSLATSEERKQQKMLQAVNMGLLNNDSQMPARLRFKMLEELEVGIPLNELPFEGRVDMENANAEIKMMLKGVPVPPNALANPTVHFETKREYYLSGEYKDFMVDKMLKDPQMALNIEQIFQENIGAYKQILDEQQERMLLEMQAQQAAAKGQQ